jgi:arabinoxylan arabinofuranohydrolase
MHGSERTISVKIRRPAYRRKIFKFDTFSGGSTMSIRFLSKFLSLPVIFIFFTPGFAENPILQTNFTADPAPMVYNDTVFLYVGHDEDTTPSSGFVMKNYLLYTSTDMVNWQDRGVAASLKNFSWAPSNGAWAAQCVYRNGKFYYYCPVQGYGIGVLVATTPYGPFTDPLGHSLLNHSWNDIDPTVFIDDDGQAYMYWGNPQCYWVKLNQDMISYSGKIDSLVPKLSTYQEAPWFYKRSGHYYLAWASTCCPEGIGYAMSTSPTGPWTYKGSIMDGNSGSSGNHPGIIDFKGKSYVFGFNYAINFSLTTVHRERRSVCLAEMPYNADGTISKLPWWGGKLPEPGGVSQVGNLNPYDTVQAEMICFEKGVRTEVCSEGGIDVDSISNGDYIKVKGVNFGSGAASFNARVASATSGGNIELRRDSLTGTLMGTCAITATGGMQSWATKSCTVTGESGVHDLYFKFTGGSGLLFNFNWWKFNASVGVKTFKKTNAGAGTTINVVKNASGLQTVIIDFSQPDLSENVKVRLFDLNGRLVTTLLDSKSVSSHTVLPVNCGHLRSGAYMIQVSVNNSVIITKILMLSN